MEERRVDGSSPVVVGRSVSLDNLTKYGFGWISPLGVIHGCSSHCHFEILNSMEEARDIDSVREYLDRVQSAYECCCSLVEAGEHVHDMAHKMAKK